MSTQTATEEQAAAPTSIWTRLGISDWEFCWIAVGVIWLLSPILLKIAIPGFALLLIVWRAEISRSPSPRWTRYREAAMAMATGKVARVAGWVFAVLTVGVVFLAYGALVLLGSGSTKSEEPTLTQAFGEALEDAWLYDFYGWSPPRKR